MVWQDKLNSKKCIENLLWGVEVEVNRFFSKGKKIQPIDFFQLCRRETLRMSYEWRIPTRKLKKRQIASFMIRFVCLRRECERTDEGRSVKVAAGHPSRFFIRIPFLSLYLSLSKRINIKIGYSILVVRAAFLHGKSHHHGC